MSRVIFILGGARSGKSAFADKLAAAFSPVIYFATASAGDEEMAERIKRHRDGRPPGWRTVEVEKDLPGSIEREAVAGGAAVVDCLTVHVSNLLCSGLCLDDVSADAEALAEIVKECGATAIIISNEVGLGIVPENELARAYRDALGRYNQTIAEVADEVLLMVAGIPLRIK
ncbi:MAG: bifunctional adenosylcobinamide kinase/adenosylcobinamide-phosphate guanylyltransferase [Actinobacteria bacterium]|nr:bifunctional adenosylcobinamide kinase/adenosylcobinamide-phosphate guanylyltransferase [Actinomycetota bacterium]